MTTYQVQPHDPTKVMGRRIVAFLIDMAILFGLATAAVFPSMSSQLETKPASQYRCRSDFTAEGSSRTLVRADICFQWGDDIRYVPQERSDRVSMQIVGLIVIFSFLDLVVLQAITGASIGKLLLGLRVIRADGQRAGPGWMALRWLLLVLVLVFCCFLWLGDLIIALVTKGHRRVGDFAAGTFVVRKQDVGQPPWIPGVTGPAWPAGTAPWAPPGTAYPPYPPVPGGPAPDQWAPPPYPPTPADPGAPTEPGQAAPGNPHRTDPIWDEARDTYIQWDEPRNRWVQWDEHANEWKPIEG